MKSRHIAWVALVCACNGADGRNGASSLMRVNAEPPGSNCPAGGTRFGAGLDDNGNGVLDDGEVDFNRLVCNGHNGVDGQRGADGLSWLTSVGVEPVGVECPAGGLRVDVGPDSNHNTALDAVEIVNSEYVCHGRDGADGQAGENGQSGLSYLTAVSQQSPGVQCADGGLRVDSGPDLDRDGVLGTLEIADTDYVCHGTPGLRSLTRMSTEPVGIRCAEGGVKLENGIDADASNVLDPIEIATTNYLCNGADGVNGTSGVGSLVDTTIEPAGGNCPFGGVRVQTGRDTDNDTILDPGEVGETQYVCDGGAGRVASVFTPDLLAANTGASLTVQQATISAPAAGTVLAIASADLYCASPAAGLGYDCASGAPAAEGYLRVSDTAAADANGTPGSYAWLTAATTLNVTRTNVFSVTGPGDYTFYLRGKDVTGALGFWRRQLTLVYMPE